jgi:putative ABC transport system permease protein
MFWRFVLGAVKFRRRRLLLAFLGLAIAATLATTLFSVYSDIDRKMHREFRAYGANLVIAPSGNARSVPLTALADADRLGVVSSPFVYTLGAIGNERVVVAGIDFRRARPLIAHWRASGARTAGADECLAGNAVAEHFHLRLGDRLPLDSGACTMRGVITTGGAEDNRLFLPFDRAAREAGFSNAASMIEVRADAEGIEDTRAALQRAVPQADVRVLHAIAETEANVVLKVRTAVFLLMALILAITIICVTGNFSALVLERGREIGILKAIGAPEARIATLMLSESMILALVSAIVGYAVGLAVSYGIGQRIFAGAAGVNFAVFLPVTAVTVFVAAVATLASASRIWRIEPAQILRGE